MSAVRPSRHGALVAVLLAAALLHGATWVGIGMGAAVLWHSISAFFFMQSYQAGMLPLVVAGALTLAAALLLARRVRWASAPAFLAMLATAVMAPRMGAASPLAPYVHPMQLVHWAALALTISGCLWLFAIANRPAEPRA
jgi:hypothetical protein